MTVIQLTNEINQIQNQIQTCQQGKASAIVKAATCLGASCTVCNSLSNVNDLAETVGVGGACGPGRTSTASVDRKSVV